MGARLTRIVTTYPELLIVIGAGSSGLAISRPLRWLDAHQGINVLLAVLVFATAVTLSENAFGRVADDWQRLGAVLVTAAIVLPALSWAASRVVPAGSLRDGVMTVGLAPCEIAAVAITALAGSDAAFAAAVLVGSTLLCVATAGAVLSLEASGSHIHSGHILVTLALVVAAPMAAGLLLRPGTGAAPRTKATCSVVAIGALGALVALVAAQVHLGTAYLAVLAAIAIIVGASAAVGVGLGRAVADQAVPILLTLSMRDFAIAAGLATAAFGPGAAAPLGPYGVVVVVWGTAIAGRLRAARRSSS